MSNDTIRARFERWFSDEGNSPKAIERGPTGAYKFIRAAEAWVVWQAAAKAEHEACASLCDGSPYDTVRDMAEKIREQL